MKREGAGLSSLGVLNILPVSLIVLLGITVLCCRILGPINALIFCVFIRSMAFLSLLKLSLSTV